jgi:hypothetical protein
MSNNISTIQQHQHQRRQCICSNNILRSTSRHHSSSQHCASSDRPGTNLSADLIRKASSPLRFSLYSFFEMLRSSAIISQVCHFVVLEVHNLSETGLPGDTAKKNYPKHKHRPYIDKHAAINS